VLFFGEHAEDVNMVGVPAYFYALTFEADAYAAQVSMELSFYGWIYYRLAVHDAEYVVYVFFYERLSHG
jgi:hypothetical protein